MKTREPGDPPLRTRPSYAFGDFVLHTAERRLERGGEPVKIGAHALDVLALLLEHAGEPVTKEQLWERAWPGVTVAETSLRFQLTGLRKILGDNGTDTRLIATLPGRGYSFVAAVRRLDAPAQIAVPVAPLPPRLSRMIGREQELAELGKLLHQHRFVNIVGPGGIGKTTLATAVAHDAAGSFPNEVCFIDLGPLAESGNVAGAVATALGLPVSQNDPTPSIVTFLKDRKTLLVLDSCEHVITAAAQLAERVYSGAAAAHLLVTSREVLRVEGERVYPLAPFVYPDQAEPMSLASVLDYAAARLFVERAVAAGSTHDFSDRDAAAIADICGRLDGIALALELAAGLVPAHGLGGTQALLVDGVRHLRGGRRTAVPRHQTLTGMLSWSFELLDQRARNVLLRLAVFVGSFTLEAVSAVATDRDIDADEAIEIVAALMAKSLVATRAVGSTVRYRLLDTTRAYLADKLAQRDDADEVARRHALYHRDLVRSHSAAASAADVPNIRAALAWCFGADSALAVSVAAGAAPLFLRLSLLTECSRLAQAAIDVLGSATGSRDELELATCLGQARMFTEGNTAAVEAAFERALELAEAFTDQVSKLRVLGALHIFHERTGDYTKAFDFAQRGMDTALRIGDEAWVAAGHSLLGIALQLLGRHAEADVHLLAAMRDKPGGSRIDPLGFGFDHRTRACIARARSLWLQGYPDQAGALAADTVEEAATLGHPVSFCIALIWAITLSGWRMDLAAVSKYLERFAAHATRFSLRPYHAVAAVTRAGLEIFRGHYEAGVAQMSASLEELRAARYELLTTEVLCVMAEGYLRMGCTDRALHTIEACLQQLAATGERVNQPDVLRRKAGILAAIPERKAEAEPLLTQALELARRQGARGWELKTAVTLAELWIEQGRHAAAHALVARVYDAFDEGFATGDLTAARRVLARTAP